MIIYSLSRKEAERRDKIVLVLSVGVDSGDGTDPAWNEFVFSFFDHVLFISLS
jgi:hypothetical protein